MYDLGSMTGDSIFALYPLLIIRTGCTSVCNVPYSRYFCGGVIVTIFAVDINVNCKIKPTELKPPMIHSQKHIIDRVHQYSKVKFHGSSLLVSIPIYTCSCDIQ